MPHISVMGDHGCFDVVGGRDLAFPQEDLRDACMGLEICVYHDPCDRSEEVSCEYE
jgi:hypothetical protein